MDQMKIGMSMRRVSAEEAIEMMLMKPRKRMLLRHPLPEGSYARLGSITPEKSKRAR